MEGKKTEVSVLFWVLSVSLFCLVASRNLAEVEEDENNSDQSAWSSPAHSQINPACQTPPSPASSGTAPSHGSGIHYSPPPTSSHGGGIHYSPPPTSSHGGGIHYSPPPTPSHGGSGGGGSGGGACNCNTPPSITPSPLVPLNPPSPTTPTPNYQAPPTPLVPLTPPSTTNPSPPLIPDPNSPPFPCSYWYTHPTAILVLFGYWGTIGQVFGTTPAPGVLFGRNLSLLEALGNTREDGYGALLREGTASLLNSMASKSFYFSAEKVREGFNTATRSEKMAAAQAKIFQKANEGHLKH